VPPPGSFPSDFYAEAAGQINCPACVIFASGLSAASIITGSDLADAEMPAVAVISV
jgi:hypothetical protein